MLYSEFIDRLVLGELNTTNVVDDNDPSVLKPVHEKKIVQYLNMGLANLFSRFALSKKQVMIRTHPAISHYYLREQFARTNSTVVPFKYIDDTLFNPFVEDVIRILTVRDECDRYLYLNDNAQCDSLFTVEFDCLKINIGQSYIYMFVDYQARHPTIVTGEVNQKIRVPLILEEALQAYVASKVLSHMNGPEHALKGQEYMMTYETLCLKAQEENLTETSFVTSDTKLRMGGFV